MYFLVADFDKLMNSQIYVYYKNRKFQINKTTYTPICQKNNSVGMAFSFLKVRPAVVPHKRK